MLNKLTCWVVSLEAYVVVTMNGWIRYEMKVRRDSGMKAFQLNKVLIGPIMTAVKPLNLANIMYGVV